MKDILHPGFGAKLAEAREAKGVTASDVANKLKLSVRQIEALEAEDLSLLPGEIFIRGFVRNYARFLGVSPDDFLVPVNAQDAVSETITAPSEGVQLASGGLKRWIVIPVVLLGIFILFVAALYQWLSQGEDALVSQSTPASETTSVVLPPNNASTVSPAVPVSGDLNAGVASLAQEASTSNALPVNAMAPVVGTSTAVATPAAPATGPVPVKVAEAPVPEKATEKIVAKVEPKSAPTTGTQHTLRFSATHDAWVQVVDGDGKRYSKLIRAGSEDAIGGAPPFKLVIGEAAQVRLSYDGHVIDLLPYIGQKVARLTLE